MVEVLFGGMPWPALGLALLLCLLVSALGFRRVDWFISLGYGFSIAAEAVLFALLYLGALTVPAVAVVVLLALYGLRLGIFLTLRERTASFGLELEASKARSAGVRGPLKVVIWISVSALYVAMASPALLSLAALASRPSVWTLWPGVLLMAAGLALEAAADQQKSRYKAEDPRRFVDRGLFAIVRSPNYFGEMLFWLGVFVAGTAAYGSIAAWLLAAIGLVCIELIMLGSARRLELKQAERYGSDPAYQNYARHVPILFPLVPLYSLKTLRVYLG